jgi:D-serine deaminase-like pyridoxal phosphate-dependent protein
VTEARPGTYVFFDANQLRMESATIEQCALTVLTTVVSTQRDGGVVVDAGLKAMSSDRSNRGSTFGLVLDAAGRVDESLSFDVAYEEHGLLTGPGSDRLAVGDRLRILPNHACGVVNMWSRVYAVRDGVAIEEWNPRGRH